MVKTGDWLPIGSVVHVGGVEDPLVIIGYLGRDNGEGRMWDYFGRKYPAGWSSDEPDVMFDREGIERVAYIGFQDERFEELVGLLDTAATKGEA